MNSSNYSRISVQTGPSPRYFKQSLFYTKGPMPGRGQATTNPFPPGTVFPCRRSAPLGRIGGRRADGSCRKEPGAGKGERSSKRRHPSPPPAPSSLLWLWDQPVPHPSISQLLSFLRCHRGLPQARVVSCTSPSVYFPRLPPRCFS